MFILFLVKKNMHSITRWIFLFSLGLATFILGLIRSDYILNFIQPDRPFLLPRNDYTADYPLQTESFFQTFLQDPRWISALLYLLYPAAATCLAVQLLFRNRTFLYIVLFFYATGFFLLLGLVGYSIVSGDYRHGYALAQYLKKIYQEPYVSLLLMGGFYWERKNKNTEN